MENKINKLFFLFSFSVVQYVPVKGIEVFFVDAETVNLSEEYFLKENTFSFVDSVNDPPTLVTNITIIKALSEETQIRLTVHGYSMGEYKIPIGMHHTSAMCDVFKEKVILNPTFRALGFTPEKCPPPLGTYINLGYVPDTSVYPISFPRNKYVISFEIALDDKPILLIKVYTDVV